MTHKRDIHKTVIWVILGLGVLCAANVAGQEVETERDLREWVERHLDRQFDGIPKGKGVIIEYTQTRSSWRSRADVEAAWDEVKEYPDHPDLPAAEILRRLSRTPEVIRGRMAYSYEGGSWRFDQVYESGAPAPGLSQSYGGTRQKRWMAGETTLLVIHEGAPFPAYSNVGLLYDDCRRLLSLVLNGGLPRFLPDANIESLSLAGSMWELLLTWHGVDFEIEIDGRLGEYGEPLVALVTRVGVGDDRDRRITLRFEDYVRDDLSGRTYPRRIVEEHATGIREVYVVNSFHLVDERRVRAEGEPPSMPADAQVLEFSKGNDEVWGLFPDAPRLVWTREGTRDFYRRPDEQNAATTSGVGSELSPTGEGDAATGDPNADLTGSAAGQAGRSWLRWIAVLLAVTVVVGVPIVVYQMRK